MFRIIGSSIALVGLLLGAAPAAEAHGARHHSSDNHYHQRAFHRNRHMPRWLWRKRGFRQWYFHTPLRFDRRLSWSRLYDAFRWERRYNFRRSYRLHYGPRYRHYDRHGRYWWDYEVRERRPKQRRRHRGH